MSILILSSHLCLRLPGGVLALCFLARTLYASLFFPIRAIRSTHIILLRSVIDTNQEAPHYVVFSIVLLLHVCQAPSISLSTAGGRTNIEVFIEFQLLFVL